MPASAKSRTSTSDSSRRPKKTGFFSKLKRVFNSNDDSVRPTRSRDDDRSSLGSNSGTMATRTRSRRSVFGSSREAKEASEAEKELEERKSRCLAIQAAKRDPPAVQRLLVDCEFCNPPPKFGHQITIENPGFTSANAHDALVEMEQLQKEGADSSDERTWNVGLDQWLRQREHWLEPTAEEQPRHFLEKELTPDRYYTVFDKLIYQTRPLKHPINSSEVCKISKAGWVAEGTWPGGSQHDAWTTSEDEATATANPDTTTAATKPSSTENGPSNPSAEATGTTHAPVRPPIPTNGTGFSSGTTSRDNTPMPPAVAHISAGGSNAPSSSTQPSPTSSPAMVSSPSSRPLSESSHTGTEDKVPKIHVQFSERPHPRDNTPTNMPSSERVQSSTGVPLQPVRSAQSSIISSTDSD